MPIRKNLPLPSWLTCSETRRLLSAVPQSHECIRFVGGCVRDYLLNRPVTDLDLATSLEPQPIFEILQKANIQTIPMGIKYGSLLAIIGSYHYEITTLRRDVETDGRHARVRFTNNWEEDAERRDFTFNALYLSTEGVLFDFFEGENDLREGKVRFIGNAALRIQEDYLRILRFFRFYAHYGTQEMDREALEGCSMYAHKLITLSRERIHHEWIKLLSAVNPYEAVYKMIETGIGDHLSLGLTLPCAEMLKKLIEVEKKYQILPSPLRRINMLYMNETKGLNAILDHLKFSYKEKNTIQSVHKASQQVGKSNDELLYYYGWEVTRDALLLQVANGKNALLFEQLPWSWQKPFFPLRGDDLKLLGIKPSPLFGAVLKQVEQWWVHHDFEPDKKKCLEKAKDYYLKNN